MLRLFSVFMISLLLSPYSYADSINLIVNGKAIHEEKLNYNEENWGLGIEYDFEEQNKWIPFITASYFKDSVSNTSKYIGAGSKRRYMLENDKDGWHFDAGIIAFFMTRKDYKNEAPFFGALPFVSIGTGKFAINATYIPTLSPKLKSLLFFQATFQLAAW